MSTRPATHGVVSLAALDLRRVPDHRGELDSQLLTGEIVRVLGASRDRGWLRVENLSDGDRGWVRAWGVVLATHARALRWMHRARARVAVSYVEVRGGGRMDPLVSPLVWGARVIAGPTRSGMRSVELPDGRRGRAPASAFAPVSSPGRPSRGSSRSERRSARGTLSITERIRELLGVPYLWGGRTPIGMDCSAFTQLVLGEQGVSLPRDAREQFRICRPLPRAETPRLGDLVFFGSPGKVVGHVGIALGEGYYAHCRGYVRINSLDENNPLYDKALGRQLRGVRRASRGPARRV